MKTNNSRAVIVAGLIGVAALANGPARAADVMVDLSGVQAANGPLYVALQTRDQFMSDDCDYEAMAADPGPGALTLTIAGVPSGVYAASVWHDIDGDGVFDRNEYGMPLDGWAISGGPFTGLPDFDTAQFEVTSDGARVALEMAYPAK